MKTIKLKDIINKTDNLLTENLKTELSKINDWDGYINTFTVQNYIDDDTNMFVNAISEFYVDVDNLSSDKKALAASFRKFNKKYDLFKKELYKKLDADVKSMDGKINKIKTAYNQKQ